MRQIGSEKRIQEALLRWFQSNKRDLPWRKSRDPYKIWLSEVMLQQTRVDQAMPYYFRFLERFPTVHDLANADIHDVLVLWEGLGYYSRARNLHHAAKTVAERYNGEFPSDWDTMRGLKGVGDYTTAAVLSIAYQKQHGVVDGNVIRFVTRYAGIEDDIRSAKTKSTIQELVNSWIPADKPGDFNQAMMELGSLVCTPKNPKCGECPLQTECIAARTLKTEQIPYKSASAKVPHHTIVAGIVCDYETGRILIARRPENAMLGGLWEFPGGKREQGESLEDALHRELMEELGIEIQNPVAFHTLKHAYSHFKITLHAYLCEIASGVPAPKSSTEIKWVLPHELLDYPFPKANRVLTQKLIETNSFR